MIIHNIAAIFFLFSIFYQFKENFSPFFPQKLDRNLGILLPAFHQTVSTRYMLSFNSIRRHLPSILSLWGLLEMDVLWGDIQGICSLSVLSRVDLDHLTSPRWHPGYTHDFLLCQSYPGLTLTLAPRRHTYLGLTSTLAPRRHPGHLFFISVTQGWSRNR